MKLVTRGVVVVHPRQPFLDWINRNVGLSSPITMQDREEDCTAILVPDLDSLEDMVACLEPLKITLFEMELRAWHTDPATWPRERTNELFDAWFELRAHSVVWDATESPAAKEQNEPTAALASTWIVTSSPDFDDSYLHVETTPYVLLHPEGTEVSGKFHIGLISGSFFGFPDGDRVSFSFEGMDEMEPVSGTGTITLQGERLTFKLQFQSGDEFTFECLPQRRP